MKNWTTDKRKNFIEKLNSIPAYTSTTTNSIYKNQLGGNFQDNIDDDELEYICLRDELGHKIIWNVPYDALKRGVNINSDNETFVEKANKVINDTNFNKEYITAWGYARLFGHAIIIIGFESLTDLDQEPEGVRGINHVKAIDKRKITKIYMDEDPSSETYGDIKSYDLTFNIDGKNHTQNIHASRTIHIVDEIHLGDVNGLSKLIPLFDKFHIKKNMDLSLAHAIYRFANPVSSLFIPSDFDEDEFEKVKEQYYLQGRNEFVWPSDFRQEFFDSNKALNPTPYIDYMFQSVAAGSEFDKVTMMGNQEGAVTGSWVNQANYFGELADSQKLKCEPVYTEFIKKNIKHGVLPEAEYEIEWPTLWEIDEKQKSEMNKNLAQAELLKATTIQKYNEVGFKPDFDENGWYIEQGGNKDRLFDQTKVKIQAKSSKYNEEKTKRTKIELEKLRKKYRLDTTLIEENAKVELMTEIIKITNKQIEKIKNIFTEEKPTIANNIKITSNKIFKTNFEIKKDDTNSAINRIKEIKLTNNKKLTKISEDMIKKSHEFGFKRTNNLSNIELTHEMPKETLDYFANRNDIHWDNATARTTAKLKYSLIEGLNNRESLESLETRVRQIVPDALRPDVFVNTEVHAAVERGRHSSYKKQGIKTVEWLTMGDERVRPEHAAREGYKFPIEEAQNLLNEPNCRCTTMPIRSVI